MANIKSQKKRIVRAERERLENRRYTSKIKTFFRRLSVFAGGFTFEAAEAVTSDFGFSIFDFGLGAEPEAIQNPKLNLSS